MIQQLITKSPEIVCKGKIYLAVRGLLLLIFSQETLCRWDVGWRMVDVGSGCGKHYPIACCGRKMLMI